MRLRIPLKIEFLHNFAEEPKKTCVINSTSATSFRIALTTSISA